jgi:uncharacterized membrane protein YqjE
MKRPPMLMHVKIRGERRGFGLWLPLFLLLPLALAAFIILSPLILIAILVFWPRGWRKKALHIFGAAFDVVSSMRGLKVDVQSDHHCIYISAV